MNTAFRSRKPRGLVTTTVFGILATGLCALACADPKPVSVTVKYADLDISTPAGALVLYKRIQAAAQGACGFYWFYADDDEARCARDAIASAVAQVNQPALSAVHAARTKAATPGALVSQSR